MTVKEAKIIFASLPESMDHLDLFITKESDFAFAPVETIKAQVIKFQEEPGGKALARNKVLVISDEI